MFVKQRLNLSTFNCSRVIIFIFPFYFVVEELYGGLSEEFILETVKEAAFTEDEYQNIWDSVLKLYQS